MVVLLVKNGADYRLTDSEGMSGCYQVDLLCAPYACRSYSKFVQLR